MDSNSPLLLCFWRKTCQLTLVDAFGKKTKEKKSAHNVKLRHMPGAALHADGLPVATSAVPEAGSESTQAAGQVWSGAEHAVYAWCALALADQRGVAVPGPSHGQPL